jgi:hypothetical protein
MKKGRSNADTPSGGRGMSYDITYTPTTLVGRACKVGDEYGIVHAVGVSQSGFKVLVETSDGHLTSVASGAVVMVNKEGNDYKKQGLSLPDGHPYKVVDDEVEDKRCEHNNTQIKHGILDGCTVTCQDCGMVRKLGEWE